MDEDNIANAVKQVDAVGWAVVSVGPSASALEMEVVATKLLGIESVDCGGYNGGGGVTRPTIGASGWLNAAEGAPPSLRIQFHNEMAYSRRFPQRVAFAMFKQADVGGTTLIVDNVKVTQSLSSPLKKKMHELGVRYTRLLYDESESDLPDFFNSWQASFCTNDPNEATVKGSGIDAFVEWYEGPGGVRRVKHTVWAPVFVMHPVFGEIYFTSVLNRHPSWQDGHAVFGALPYECRPYQCVWGDGTAFSDREISELREVQDGAMERIELQQGEVLVLDNLRVQHGRTTFSGPRLLGLKLSGMVNRDPRYMPPLCFKLAARTPGIFKRSAL
eukprot:TRINITY_DN25891_c0_g1_i1.p1 TRINITY_DN25891_c0_g1~~TRINITY_DN25891_c0_g1_i1.p1  ORF type:complete len:330 (-),score=34.12 TRINITY_DN25891_c0_g1_i1:205-1194(-)